MPEPTPAAAAEVSVPAVFPAPEGAAPAATAAAAAGDAPGESGERFAHGVVSRTWDMELLISGVVVFALLQAPAALNAAFDRFEPLLAGQARMLLRYGHVYGSLVLYVLIGAFLLHLCARAYWVGLIGLDSVFPHGIRWERARSTGPIGREAYEARVPALPSLIRRLDDFCSVIFPTAFMLVVIFVAALLLVSATLALPFAAQRLLGRSLDERLAAGLLLGIAVLNFALAQLDRRLGHRIRGRPRAWVRRLFVGMNALVAMPLYGPIMMTLLTNVRRRWFWSLFALPMLGVFAVHLARDGELRLDSAFYLPDTPTAHTVDYAFYRDQRPADEVFRVSPSIQSDVVAGPYLKLFLPYAPGRHNAAMAARCPGVRPLHRNSLRLFSAAPSDSVARQLLACLTRLQPVTLNGRPLTLDFNFYQDPRTGARGLLAYVPTEGLPRGRNLLTVARLPRYQDGRPQGTPSGSFVIPFWR